MKGVRMLKILHVTDKKDTAIDRLAQGVKRYNDNIDYVVVDVHPKRPSGEQLAEFNKHLDADIIHWGYFRTAEMLRDKYDLKQKQILTHYNPYSIKESDWNTYDHVVACNKSIFEDLEKITTAPLSHIPLTIDTDFWTYKREWEPNKNVIMVANRIESKKGILPVAEACKVLGLKLILVGAVSDPEYLHEVLRTGVVDFRQEITNEELRELYWDSTLHVCNSIDNYESGTLPILEAMLTGVPVLTREIGHVPELNNEENMVINKASSDDTEALTALMRETLEDTTKLERMRQKAWDTAKTRSDERRAYLYQKLYREVMWPDQKSVSVVMPVAGEINHKSIDAVLDQDYENLEIIICNDGPHKYAQFEARARRIPVKLIQDTSKGYGLAKQRNLGIIEATGEIIVFCDQRMVMDKNAVSEFVKALAPKRWVYGNKGVKKDFVENFSAVYRDNVIHCGMFNERIDAWGGMSQYIRSVAKYSGMKIEYVESAKATPEGSSKNKHTKKQDVIRIKNRLWKMGLEL